MSIYSLAWGTPDFDSSFSRSYTSATMPSNNSLTQLSILTVAKAEVVEGFVVTTILSVVTGGTTNIRMMVNDVEINAEGSTGTTTSVLTVRPSSTLTADAWETFTSISGTSEENHVDVPWNSINTVTCEGLYIDTPSNMTLRSSRMTSVPSNIYQPTWGDAT